MQLRPMAVILPLRFLVSPNASDAYMGSGAPRAADSQRHGERGSSGCAEQCPCV
ncbi:hypothetical protein IG631_08165 [Alternaria alternata]|nr:hypothetical protein IG631_08165 [Alternaria alternata]